MQKEHLAIASVPCQSWGECFTAEQALKNGTIFKDLYLPFFAAEKNCGYNGEDRLKQKAKGGEKCLLQEIDEVSFFLDDLTLYLDTHPDDQEALRLFHDYSKERALMKKEFAETYYPLTRDCILECGDKTGKFCWQEGPIPWEGVCV